MAKILCFDTSLEVCSVALSRDGEETIYLEEKGYNIHSSRLNVLIEEVLNAGGVKVPDLDAICVNKGPGSYTGLRIGVSTAKGLSYSHDIPLISVNTIGVMLARAVAQVIADDKYHTGMLFCPMIDARRMEVYYAIMNSDGEYQVNIKAAIIDEGFLTVLPDKSNICFFGNGMPKSKTILSQHQGAMFLDEDIYPGADWISGIAKTRFEARDFEDLFSFEPFYLKDFFTLTKDH